MLEKPVYLQAFCTQKFVVLRANRNHAHRVMSLQGMYVAVALEMLQQAARAFERVLIDGGPCRW